MGGKTGDGGHIATCLGVYTWALLIDKTKAISIGKRLLQSFKGMVASYRINNENDDDDDDDDDNNGDNDDDRRMGSNVWIRN